MIAKIQEAVTDFQEVFKDELTDRNVAGLNKIQFELNLLSGLKPKRKSKKVSLKLEAEDSTKEGSQLDNI
ncbi:MAG: hypothetical protein DRR06_20375 [Gammaproteobacteria bacterium]|nr:MAG: hypothetical protein DRR06_20375 [Gammaproteobacteria bacterium]